MDIRRTKILPTTPRGRLVLGVLSLALLPVSAPFAALFVWSLLKLVLPAPQLPWDLRVKLLLILLEETLFAVFLACFLGLLWAIWTPAWVERISEKVARHAYAGMLLFWAVWGAILLFLPG